MQMLAKGVTDFFNPTTQVLLWDDAQFAWILEWAFQVMNHHIYLLCHFLKLFWESGIVSILQIISKLVKRAV